VIHKPNGGVSDARNAGLDIAQGDYIGFVDSDDYIAPDMYETLLELSERTEAGISVTGLTEVTETGDKIREWENLDSDRTYNREDFIKKFFPTLFWKVLPIVCNKLFKRELFENIRFPVGCIYEDARLQLPLYDLCESIAVSERYCYFYTVREGSIMRSSFSEKNLQIIDLALEQYKFFAEKEINDQREYALDAYVKMYLRCHYGVELACPALKQALMPYRKVYCRFFFKILKSPKICRMKKLMVVLSHINASAAYQLAKKYFPECLPAELQ